MKTLITFLIAVFSLTSLYAECNLSFQLTENDAGFVYYRDDDQHYNPMDSTRYQNLNFVVQNLDTSERDKCPYMITASVGSSGDFSQRTLIHTGGNGVLNYNIQKDSRGRKIVKDTSVGALSKDNVIEGDTPKNGGSQTKRAKFSIPDDQNVASGHYRDTITFSLYDIDIKHYNPNINYTPVQTITVVLDAYVIPLISITTGSTIDFGYPETGESQNFTVLVYSNADYDIVMTSREGGELKHTSGQSDLDGIPYVVRIDPRGRRGGGRGGGQQLTYTLSTTPTTLLSDERRDEDGKSHLFFVVLGQVPSSLFAGDYQDEITIQIQDH